MTKVPVGRWGCKGNDVFFSSSADCRLQLFEERGIVDTIIGISAAVVSTRIFPIEV